MFLFEGELCQFAKDVVALGHTDAQPHAPALMTYRGAICPSFLSRQQCVAEAFGLLMSKLFDSDVGRYRDLLPEANAATDFTLPSWKIFGALCEVNIECAHCHRVMRKFDPTNCLALAIPGAERPDLQGAIKGFLKSERMSGYKCDGCKQESSVMSQRLVVRPPVLAIHVKRWIRQNTRRKAVRFVKDPRQISFPEVLSMDELGRREYKLRAVIVHESPMCFAGHYIAYARGHHDRWLKFDDGEISEVQLGDVLAAQAYMLFYEEQWYLLKSC